MPEIKEPEDVLALLPRVRSLNLQNTDPLVYHIVLSIRLRGVSPWDALDSALVKQASVIADLQNQLSAYIMQYGSIEVKQREKST